MNNIVVSKISFLKYQDLAIALEIMKSFLKLLTSLMCVLNLVFISFEY